MALVGEHTISFFRERRSLVLRESRSESTISRSTGSYIEILKFVSSCNFSTSGSRARGTDVRTLLDRLMHMRRGITIPRAISSYLLR